MKSICSRWLSSATANPAKAARGSLLPGDTGLTAPERERGLRPVTLSRMGGEFRDYGVAGHRPTGAWADHRYAVHSTHDIGGTFEMMEFAARFTAGIGASIGVPYEAHVVGGFFGSRSPPDDLFVRWVQMAMVLIVT